MTVASAGSEQVLMWPAPPQLCLPWELVAPVTLPEPPRQRDRVPDGVEPVVPPAFPPVVESVDRALASACRALGITVPRVRWFHPVPVSEEQRSYEDVYGFVFPGEQVIWLRGSMDSPLHSARTAAHEAVHLWQDRRRGSCLDELEHSDREDEA